MNTQLLTWVTVRKVETDKGGDRGKQRQVKNHCGWGGLNAKQCPKPVFSTVNTVYLR